MIALPTGVREASRYQNNNEALLKRVSVIFCGCDDRIRWISSVASTIAVKRGIYDVAVIGGGCVGLSTALELQADGCNRKRT